MVVESGFLFGLALPFSCLCLSRRLATEEHSKFGVLNRLTRHLFIGLWEAACMIFTRAKQPDGKIPKLA